jgi:hypothetical protein
MLASYLSAMTSLQSFGWTPTLSVQPETLTHPEISTE